MTLNKRNRQRGMTLIELMVACFVLVVGMLGSLAMILMAIATNGRNKYDTTGTMLAQMVIEQIATLPTNTSTTQITLTDCTTLTHAGQPHAMAVVGGDIGVPTGAALVPETDVNRYRRPGDIDFTEAAPPAGYSMTWHSCGDLNFDVRWNVNQVNERTRLITVSARQVAFARNNANLYAPPVTLRTISGP
jgi:type II secretory pathway pseudopilin PulG